ncbi:MAG: flagellin [Synergistaceae bacterium]|nr:flagellin [Synergistaceae bacterium]
MRIYHNIPALTAYNSLQGTNNAMEKTIQKLSTGLRINSAADDAAGFAISEKMRAQIAGLEVAIRNTQDATSMLQVAEGALGETNSMLQRMRELAVQASNDTLTAQDRSYIQLEFDQLEDQLDRIAKTTQFNKKRLLDGSSAGITSSSNQSVKVYVRGSLREIDQFGQKKSFEGNYKIKVDVDPSQTGTGQVQKSSVMTIKHPNVITDMVVDKGIQNVTVDNLPAADYTVTRAVDPADEGQWIDSDFVNGDTTNPLPAAHADDAVKAAIQEAISIDVTNSSNAKLSFTVTNVDATAGSEEIELEVTSSLADTPITVTLNSTTKEAEIADQLGLSDTAGDVKITLDDTKLADLVAAVTQDTKFAYTVGGDKATHNLTGFYNAGSADDAATIAAITFDSDDSQTANASVLFEVVSKAADNTSVTLRATSSVLGTDGNVDNKLVDEIIVTDSEKSIGEELGLGSADACKLKLANINNIDVGTKFVYNYSAVGTGIQVEGTQDKNWPNKWGNDGDKVTCDQDGNYTNGNPVKFGLDSSQDLNSKDIHFRNFYVNGENGDVYEGDIILTTTDTFTTDAPAATDGDKLASFTAAYIGKTATLDTKLRDLNVFWNSSGVFMLENPQTITINQGDGKSATVTLYGTDTIRELQAKFNYAIGTELGQAKYVDGTGASKFCTFVEKGYEDPQGLETVPGTFIFRSVLPGAGGDLTFTGEEDMINTFALNVVKESSTAAFRASIYDAHTGIAIKGATNVKVSDNKLIGVLHDNVDIEFDATANIKAVWSDAEKNFILTPDDSTYEAIIHIVDSSTVFQIGANEGEDIAIDIGNMSAASLGVTNVNLTTRESAAKAIGQIDAAINKVSSQRAKIGAYQNALDYTSENLTTTMTNLTAAESRIRDADMAQTMMEFVKLQILNQSGTSMLAQANQLPQSVLSLLNG